MSPEQEVQQYLPPLGNDVNLKDTHEDVFILVCHIPKTFHDLFYNNIHF